MIAYSTRQYCRPEHPVIAAVVATLRCGASPSLYLLVAVLAACASGWRGFWAARCCRFPMPWSLVSLAVWYPEDTCGQAVGSVFMTCAVGMLAAVARDDPRRPPARSSAASSACELAPSELFFGPAHLKARLPKRCAGTAREAGQADGSRRCRTRAPADSSILGGAP
jgi:hypothetical protein